MTIISLKISKVFNTLTLKQILENKNLLHKTGVHFLVEATKIEVTPFPFKTALSEANVKNGDYKMDQTKRVEFCQ